MHQRTSQQCLLTALPLLLLAATGCNTAPVPAAEFVAQADRLHNEALASTVTPDPDLREYFIELGKRVIDGATKTNPNFTRDPVFAGMQFQLVGSGTPNAFTTGGRYVYIYAGLLAACESEEELAAVMCHQFAHAIDLDVQKTDMRPSENNSVDQIAYLFVANRFTQGMEREAEERALEFYARGGWDPQRYADLFDRIRLRGTVATSPDRLALEARAATAREQVRKLPPQSRNWRQANVADPPTFLDLRQRGAAGGERAAPGNRAWLFLRAFPNCVLPSDTPAQQAAQEQLRIDVTPKVPQRELQPS